MTRSMSSGASPSVEIASTIGVRVKRIVARSSAGRCSARPVSTSTVASGCRTIHELTTTRSPGAISSGKRKPPTSIRVTVAWVIGE